MIVLPTKDGCILTRANATVNEDAPPPKQIENLIKIHKKKAAPLF